MSEQIDVFETIEQVKINKIKENSKNLFRDIERFITELKRNLDDDTRFEELLNILHGRFSKMELNMLELEKLEE